MQALRAGVRFTLQGPHRHLHGSLKRFRGSRRNSARRERRQSVFNEFDGLTDHIGKASSETRMFKSFNCAFQGGQIVGRHFSLSGLANVTSR
jgi:hypothetical protein